MIRRVFWFSLGAGATIFVLAKVRQYARKATPSAVAHRMSGSVAGVRESVSDFTATVRAAMAEREAELRAVLIEHSAAANGLGRSD